MSKLPFRNNVRESGMTSTWHATISSLTDRFSELSPRLSLRDSEPGSSNCSHRSPSSDSGIVVAPTPPPRRKRSALSEFLTSTKALIRFPLHNNHHASAQRRVNTAHIPFSALPQSSRAGPNEVLTVDVDVHLHFESPPITLFKNQTLSTGAIFSGLLDISLLNPSFLSHSAAKNIPHVYPYPGAHHPSLPSTLDITSLDIRIVRRTSLFRPLHTKCPECHMHRQVLAKVHYSLANLPIGKTVNYPVSHLFPGCTPATSISSLCEIRYFLEVDIMLHQSDRSDSPSSEVVTWERELMVHRSLLSVEDSLLSANRITSIRKIESTPIKIKIDRPIAVYPDSTIRLEMSALSLQIDPDAVTTRTPVIVPKGAYRRWSVAKVFWKVVQNTKMDKTTCPHHPYPLLGIEGVSKEYAYRTVVTEGLLLQNWMPVEVIEKDNKTGADKITVNSYLTTTIDLNIPMPDLTKPGRRGGHPPPLSSTFSFNNQHEKFGFSVGHRLEMNFIMEEEVVMTENFSAGLEKRSPSLPPLPKKTEGAMSIQFGMNIELTETPLSEQLTAWDEDIAPAYSSSFARPPDYNRTFEADPPAYETLECREEDVGGDVDCESEGCVVRTCLGRPLSTCST